MQGLKYQLKNVRRDKLCLLTFLLPIIVGLAVNIMSDLNFQTLGEISFGSIQNELAEETVTWLEKNGNLTQYQTTDELRAAVNDPSTQMIGVLRSKSGIRTMLSGDEFGMYQTIGDTLPQLYEQRKTTAFTRTVVSVSADHDGLKSLLTAVTLITAMFMGCTFNAMNIIGEKEDGVAFINQILPMTARTYLVQKLLLGFIGGAVSAVITALICIRVSWSQGTLLFVMMIFSAFLASLAGLFIGHFSSGLMTGIVYIKVVMILFLAPPIVCYLIVPAESMMYKLSYLIPSSVTFYGLMDLLNGQADKMVVYLMVLLIHIVLWSCVYFFIDAKVDV